MTVTVGALGALVVLLLGPSDGEARKDFDRQVGSGSIAADEDVINPDRPGIADGSRVIARGQLQIETGFQVEFRDELGTRTRTSLLPVLIRVGLGTGLEARVETNTYAWTEVHDAGRSDRTSAWTPASLGIKYQIHTAGTSLQRSIGGILRVFPASGSGEFRTGRTTGDVRLAADVDVAPRVSLNPNAGIGRYEGTGGTRFTAALLALTCSYAASDRLSSFVDVAYQRPVDAGGADSLVVDGGVAYVLGRNVQLDFSLGSGAHGPGPRPFVSFGVSLRSQ